MFGWPPLAARAASASPGSPFEMLIPRPAVTSNAAPASISLWSERSGKD